MFEACALSSAIIHPSGSNNVDTDRETNKRDKAEVHDAHVFFPDQVERVESSFRFSSHYACRLLFFSVQWSRFGRVVVLFVHANCCA